MDAAEGVRPGAPRNHASLSPVSMPPTAAVAACVQSWGAFKRALELDPAHGLSLQNRRDLTGFLSHTSEGQRIMHANLWH